MSVTEFTRRAPKRVEQRLCAQCGGRMLIVRINPVGLGFDVRAFECTDCNREETVVVKRA